MEINLKKPFLNRELSWLDFNGRVLEEALDRENPVMERLRFLAITASNLDEFFMVRVAGVKENIRAGVRREDVSGLTPEKLYELLTEKIRPFVEKQYQCLHRSILPQLRKCGIFFLDTDEWDDMVRRQVSAYFDRILFPVLTPMAVDRSRPLPKLANKSLNIAVHLYDREKKEDCFALVQVPSILPRFLEVPGTTGRSFVLLEDILCYKMEALFAPHEIVSCCPFRITRDSDLEIDEEGEDFLAEVKKSIKKRKSGRPVRLEVLKKCDSGLRDFLVENLKLKKDEIYKVAGPLDLTFLSKVASLPGKPEWSFAPIVPVNPPADFWGAEDIFSAIRERDRLVHHPYESFDCVVDFIRTAAEDPDVLAIKQTLYRVSGHSPIIAALIRAAENGKQVTVLVELKARFDEENNLQWADKLEHAGCHVIYGLAGLKTHCKIALVVRREEDGIRRYLHLGTGNYNDSTARIYTDIGMFTCKEPFGADASSLFNVLTGYSQPPEYLRFAVAPTGLRSFFCRMIRQEIDAARQGLPAGIKAKVNSLVDPEIIQLLYEASQAGVPVRLIVRGICCLIPGVEGLSENIQVCSIVGQLLEHSRIFRFENGGEPKIYMGSADWMPRNLDRRVELVFPVEEELAPRVEEILDVLLRDTENTRIMLPDGTYQHVDRRGRELLNCHQEFSRRAEAALAACGRIDQEKPLKPLRRQKTQETIL